MRTKTLIFLTFAFMATGCMHPKIGPQSLPRDRSRYSISLADSWKELTLLNIVKVRYLDPPVYVDIGNIVSATRCRKMPWWAGILREMETR